jgi:hypothetical protein
VKVATVIPNFLRTCTDKIAESQRCRRTGTGTTRTQLENWWGLLLSHIGILFSAQEWVGWLQQQGKCESESERQPFHHRQVREIRSCTEGESLAHHPQELRFAILVHEIVHLRKLRWLVVAVDLLNLPPRCARWLCFLHLWRWRFRIR